MDETIRVNNLITELLDLVRPKESHFAYGDLHDLIEKMVLLVSPQSREKRIQIKRLYDPAAEQIWMDSEKMKQVILNLLSNALEFTPQEGTIAIATKYHSADGVPRSLSIEVGDNGVGIQPGDINKVFDPYFTTKHKSSMHKGTGLGLFITYQHVQDHKGTIEVKSKVNEGTTFLITIPVKPLP
jgi:signal transduction histidine kinase